MQIGEGLTCAHRAWQSFAAVGSIASLAAETTDGDILVAFFGPKVASEAISECLI